MPQHKINDGLTRAQRYFLKHRDEINVRKRLRRQNPEFKAKERAKAQSPEGRASSRRRTKKFRESEKGKAYLKQYYIDNREHILQRTRDYHARPEIKLRDKIRTLTRKYGDNVLQVLERDNYTCVKCGSQEKFTVHHIDGDRKNDALDNMVVLCGGCHSTLHLFVPKTS